MPKNKGYHSVSFFVLVRCFLRPSRRFATSTVRAYDIKFTNKTAVIFCLISAQDPSVAAFNASVKRCSLEDDARGVINGYCFAKKITTNLCRDRRLGCTLQHKSYFCVRKGNSLPDKSKFTCSGGADNGTCFF